MLVFLFGAPIWRPTKSVQEMRQLTKWTFLVSLDTIERTFLRCCDTWKLKSHAKISVLWHLESSRVSNCYGFDQISNCFIFICGREFKEQLCGGLRLRFWILMTSHENQHIVDYLTDHSPSKRKYKASKAWCTASILPGFETSYQSGCQH